MGLISNESGIPDWAQSVTPNDASDIDDAARCVGIRAGSAGNLTVVFADRPDTDTVTFVGVLAGETVVGKIRRVMQTGTNAGDLVALMVSS